MKAAFYGDISIALLARTGSAAVAGPAAVDRRNLDRVIEWEFSDEMRDPRFLPGWYILPGLALAGVIIAFVFWAI